MCELDLVVFDMAGTTIRATDQVPAAFRKAFARVDIALADDEIDAIRGRSKAEAIAELLKQHDESRDPAKVYADFQQILIQKYRAHGVEAIDGADATFDWLKSRNAKIAMSTGFDRGLAELLLHMVGWTDVIDVLVCNDDVARGRPAPDMLIRAMAWTACEHAQRVAAVGDTISDLEAARSAGVRWSIGVLSGAHSEEQLKACPHTAIVPSVAELPAVLVSG